MECATAMRPGSGRHDCGADAAAAPASGPRCRRPRRHRSDQVSDHHRRHGPRRGRSSRAVVDRAVASCALYDDELCFGVVAAWTDVSALLIRALCQQLNARTTRRVCDVIAANRQ